MAGSKWDKPGLAAHIESVWSSPDELELRQVVADWIGPNAGRLLDLGCGTARMAPLLKGCRYIGLDGSAEMLKIARTRVSKGSLKLCDFTAEPLPFPDQVFDTAICMQVMRHLSSYQLVLRELARVVKGRVFFQDAFHHGTAHIYGTTEHAGITFHENAWSLRLFVTDVAAAFPGWRIESVVLAGMWAGVKVYREAME
jgi:ubiquinone/menaquinone biosynthesis C-methylase UbiE